MSIMSVMRERTDPYSTTSLEMPLHRKRALQQAQGELGYTG